MTEQISNFTDDAARARILSAYDRAMAYWPEPRGEQDVPTRFGSTRVHSYGAGEGTPVLLLHGQSATPAEWAPYVEALARAGRRVLAVDRMGEPGYTVQRLPIGSADDTAAWLEETLIGLGLERVHLVGHSYGGCVALQHALRAPGRIVSLSVYDPPRALAPLKPGFLLSAVVAALSGSDSFQRRWFTRLVGDTGANVEEAEAGMRVSLEAINGFRIRLPQPQRMSDEELRSIEIPTLVLLGGADRVMDSQKAEARVRRLIPDVRTEVVAGAGHGIPLEIFNRRVPEFLHEVEHPGIG
ncbi:alpha/beta fold hydrolase [Streptomyces sp. NBC_01214]|uniref:alpha/beta fold hydrolase n=1 Tax=Streptomyces sp. NBC_01214 TaxID=2903777 RepID=UPI00225454D1|nr:alpha/beta fold hydrolase [Streptomyces sp. NBC_01214]MCX4808649.1 alpha/beta fold hydrolase [Streptomyces sp. NBC_01214]